MLEFGAEHECFMSSVPLAKLAAIDVALSAAQRKRGSLLVPPSLSWHDVGPLFREDRTCANACKYC